MRAKNLSANILKNTVSRWGKFCEKSEDFKWTKHDSNAMLLIVEESRRADRLHYEKHKAKKNKELYIVSGTGFFKASSMNSALLKLSNYFANLTLNPGSSKLDIMLPGTDLEVEPYDNTKAN